MTLALIILTAVILIGYTKWKLSTKAIIYWLLEKKSIELDADEIQECTKIVIKKTLEDLMKSKR